MFQNTISNIILEIWPMIIITVVILTSLRIMDIIINKKKIVLYKDLLILLFAIYILCLFHIVTFQDVNFASSNFIPFGFFTSYLIKTKKIYVPVILTAIISITIETTQLYIGRIFDIDDIILNIIGGIIGYLFYIFLEEIKNHLPAYLKKDWFLNTIIILIILLVLTWLINSFSINLIGG